VPEHRPTRHRPAGLTAASRRWAAGAVALAALVASVSLAPAAAAAVPSGWQTIVDDSFDRTVSDSWGSAPTGGEYRELVNGNQATGEFDVASGKGSIALTPGQAATAILPVSTVDSQTKVTLVVPDLGSIKAGLHETIQARRQDNGDAYRGRVYIGGSGSVTLSFSRVIGGADTGLAEVRLPFMVAAGNQLNLEFSVIGTGSVVLQSRAWLTTDDQPDWQASYTDTASAKITAAGTLGLWIYEAGGGSPFTLLNTTLQAWAPPGGVSTSTPTTTPTTTTTTTTKTTTTTTTTPTTTTTTTTTAPPPSSSGRGAGSIGSASFSVPSGAKFVATNGNDGNSGSQSSPYRTLAAALANAGAGTTIVLRAGSYNESVTVDEDDITIQNYPGEAVWLDGSVPVGNWSKSGSTWVASGWTAEFDRSTSQTRGDTSTRLIRPEYPLASWPDQVFVNGTQLTQVSSAGAVTAGTFYVSYSSNTLTIGSDPSGKNVVSSNKSRAIRVNSKDVTIQGIGIRRYGTSMPDGATLLMYNTGATVKNVEISDNATIGLSISNNNAVVDNVTVVRNGQLGVGANAAYNFKMSDSIVSDNNTQHFKDAPVSGGIKMTRSRGIMLNNNEISRNISAGFWCDESCYDINVLNNTVADNTTAGVQLEISEKAVVANNLFTGNGNAVQIMNTGNVRIFNNEIGGYTYYGIRLNQDTRRNANTSTTGHDPRQPNPDPTMPWYLHDIVASNNVISASGRSQFYGVDPLTGQSLDAIRVTINGNLFNAYTGSGARMVGWGQANGSVVYYDNPDALAAAKNSGWKNAAMGQQSLTSMQSAKGGYNSIAVGLPSDVASLLGQSSGSKNMGRY
jgi:parallel beta-helix repeat protein